MEQFLFSMVNFHFFINALNRLPNSSSAKPTCAGRAYGRGKQDTGTYQWVQAVDMLVHCNQSVPIVY